MRSYLAIALALFGVSAARAADLPLAGYGGYYAAERAGLYTIYDDQPGVVIRAYWREPWRNRHYFPMTGIRPAAGRRERMSGGVRKPAESFSREWVSFPNNEIVVQRVGGPRHRELPPEPYSK